MLLGYWAMSGHRPHHAAAIRVASDAEAAVGLDSEDAGVEQDAECDVLGVALVNDRLITRATTSLTTTWKTVASSHRRCVR